MQELRAGTCGEGELKRLAGLDEKNWARERATSRRRKSPTTMPLTRPFGFCSATMRPRPMAAAMPGGTCARARSVAARTKARPDASSSKTRRHNSEVWHWGPLLLLYGHGAGLQGACGRRARQAPQAGILKAPGPGARTAGRIAWLGRATRQGLAAESSPWLTSLAARSARPGGETGGCSGWDAMGGTLREQLPPAGLEVQKPRAAVGARGVVEQQAGQEQPQCPGPHLSGGILGPRDINCPKSQRERCTERSSEEFGRALEKETALLKEHLQIHLVKTGKGRTNWGAV